MTGLTVLFSLRGRLVLLVLLAVLPALGLIVYSASESRRQAVVEAQADALRLAHIASAEQDQLIGDAHELLVTLIQLPAVRTADPASCNSLLSSLLKQYPLYANFGVVRANGDVACSGKPIRRAANLAGAAWFQRAVQARGFAMGDYQMGPISGRPVLTFGYPIVAETGQVQTVVYASLDMNWLNQFASEAGLPQGSTLVVLNGDGTILFGEPDPDRWIGHAVSEVPVIRNMLARQSEGATEVVDMDGVPRLYTFTPLRSPTQPASLYMSIGVPGAVAFGRANQVLVRNLAGLGVVVLLAVAAAWWGSEIFLLRHVAAILEATRRLAAGELSARTGISHGRDEIGRLARAFDDMAGSLEQHEALLEQRVAERTAELSTLLDVSHNVASTLNLDRLLGLILDQLKTVVDYTTATVLMVEGEDLTVLDCRGPSQLEDIVGRRFPLSSMGPAWAVLAERHEPTIVSDVRVADARHEIPASQAMRLLTTLTTSTQPGDATSCMAVPLVVNARLIGVLSLVHIVPEYYTQRRADLALAIANQAGVAIENARLYEQTHRLAALEERQRLGRELHDSVSQALYGIVLGARTARALQERDPGRVAQTLDYLLSLADAGLSEMRALIFDLRPESLESEGLVAGLKHQAKFLRAGRGVQVRTDLCEEPDMSLPAKEAVYSIAREALHNTFKHARASHVELHLAQDASSVTLQIVDDGVGFDPQGAFPGHLGLRSMRERAAQLGGSLELESTPGGGTRIRVRIPAATPPGPDAAPRLPDTTDASRRVYVETTSRSSYPLDSLPVQEGVHVR